MIDTLDVEVTADDIAAGKPHRASACPIALAIKRALDSGVESVGVTRHYVRIDDDEAPMPPEGHDFVKYFDSARSRSPEERAEHIKPFKMTLKFGPAEEAE